MITRNPKTVIFVLLAYVTHAVIAEPEKRRTMKVDPDNDLTKSLLRKDKASMEEIDSGDSDDNRLTIWEVEDGDRVPFIRNLFSPFETEKCYIIQKRFTGELPNDFRTYYWIGEYSPDGIAFNAAQYAVLFDFKARNEALGPSSRMIDSPLDGKELKALLSTKSLGKTVPQGKNMIAKIQREAEDYETRDFVRFLEQSTLKRKRMHGSKSHISKHAKKSKTENKPQSLSKRNAVEHLLGCPQAVPTEPDVNEKKMFVLSKRDGKVVIDEVEVSLRILQRYNTKICVVLISKTVYVYCGKTAKYDLRRGAEELAKIMLKKRGRCKTDYEIIRDNELLDQLPLEEKRKVSALFAELPPKPTTEKGKDEKFTPAQLKIILDPPGIYTKGYFNHVNMKHVRVYFDNKSGVLRRIKVTSGGFLERAHIDKSECFVCDVESNHGLIVWMGKMSPINVRAECARAAETYLREDKFHYALPINYFDEIDQSYDREKYVGTLFNSVERDRMDSVSLLQASYPPEDRN